MSQQNKEARSLRRQIRYVLRISNGRLELSGPRERLLRSIGRFVDRVKFESRGEAARALGISPSRFDYVIKSYQRLAQAEKKALGRGKKLKLARVKIVEEPVKSLRAEQRPMELVLESGVRVSVQSADAAVELLERLEQRKRRQAAA